MATKSDEKRAPIASIKELRVRNAAVGHALLARTDQFRALRV